MIPCSLYLPASQLTPFNSRLRHPPALLFIPRAPPVLFPTLDPGGRATLHPPAVRQGCPFRLFLSPHRRLLLHLRHREAAGDPPYTHRMYAGARRGQ